MSVAAELLEAVRASTRGTPYAVTPTPTGFDVAIDIADSSWYAMAYKQHLSLAWIYHVKVDEAAKTLSITDDVRDLNWKVGVGAVGGVPVPVLSVGASRKLGRFELKSFRKTWAVNEAGEPGKVVDYTFSASEGRDLIRGPARDLGWQEKTGAAQRIGLIVGVGTTIALVLAGIGVLIAFLTEYL